MDRSNRRIAFVARAMSEMELPEWRALDDETRRTWFGKARRALAAADRFDDRQEQSEFEDAQAA